MSSISSTVEPIERDASPCWACGARPVVDETYRAVGLWRCASCGLVYAAAERAAAAVSYDEDYFDSYPGGEAYEEDERQRRYEAALRLRYLRRFAVGGHLLEVGAAAGYFLEAAARDGFEVMGIEPARPVAERVSARLGVPVQAGLLEDAELPTDGLDAICAWHVVEHIPDPVEQLARLRDALAPGGRLLLEVPNVASVIASRLGASWFHLDPGHHVAVFTPRSLTSLLERAGFAVEATETVSALRYLRPGRVVRPRSLVAFAKETGVVRAPSLRHPWKHEMLRAAARRG